MVKNQKVSKYYETDCLQNFVLLFIFLLTIKFVKNSHIWPEFSYLYKKGPKANLKLF